MDWWKQSQPRETELISSSLEIVEIDSSIADGPQSVILEQVKNGVAMRMSIMDSLLS